MNWIDFDLSHHIQNWNRFVSFCLLSNNSCIRMQTASFNRICTYSTKSMRHMNTQLFAWFYFNVKHPVTRHKHTI